MSSRVQTIYLDSNVFLAVVSAEYWRMPALVPLLERIDAGAINGVTSTATIAEVRRYAERADEARALRIDPQVERIHAMWKSGRIGLYPVTEFIALRAAELGDLYADLLPLDCLHIATAEFARVDMLFTFDGAGKRRRKPESMRHYDGAINGLRIVEPFLPIGPLFDNARMDAESEPPPTLSDTELEEAGARIAAARRAAEEATRENFVANPILET